MKNITYHISTNHHTDTFVGVKRENGCLSICFPFGYSLPAEPSSISTHTKTLIHTLQRHLRRPDVSLPASDIFNVHLSEFPINDFATLIHMADMNMRFYQNGTVSSSATSQLGGVDYKKTYDTKVPEFYNRSFVYSTPARRASVTSTQVDTRVMDAFAYAVARGRQLFNGLYGDGTYLDDPAPEVMRVYQQAVDAYLTRCDGASRPYAIALVHTIEFLANDTTARYYFGTMDFNEIWGRLLASRLASTPPQTGYKSFAFNYNGQGYLAYPHFSLYAKEPLASNLPMGEALEYLKLKAKSAKIKPALILPTDAPGTLTKSTTINTITIFHCPTTNVVV